MRIENERVAAGGSYDRVTGMYTFRVDTNNRFEIDWLTNKVSYQQEKGLVVTVPGDQLGENGVTLAVETKSGTKKFNFNWSDMEGNFTVNIEGMPVRLMPLYVEGEEGKTSIFSTHTFAATDCSLRFACRFRDTNVPACRSLWHY